jgi:autotransporter-associated beta strand protein
VAGWKQRGRDESRSDNRDPCVGLLQARLTSTVPWPGPPRARLLRCALLATSALFAASLVATTPSPAFAQQATQGGRGGNNGGVGGLSSATDIGDDGATGASPVFGGGGGGAGAIRGGFGGTGGGGVAGGATGVGPGGDGGTGGLGSLTTSGGGGGGGAHGGVVTVDTSNSATITGGKGGNGGASTGGNRSGGGGGAAGYGLVIDGSGVTYTNTAGSIAGGTGGTGGADVATGGNGGSGGDGGYGVLLTGNSTLVNAGTIAGGTGGSGGNGTAKGGLGGNGGVGVAFSAGGTLTNSGTITGAAKGAEGTGGSIFGNSFEGAGAIGANLTIVNSGSISGGLVGVDRGNAIAFTGGANTLTLQGAWSLTGNIDVTGSLSFNQATAVSLSNVITGTGSVIQNGIGTLTLSGANTYTGGTTIQSGTLQIGNDSALGTGALTMAQGTTLTFDSSNHTIANNIVISGDPTFDVANGTTQTITGVISDGGPPGVVEKTGGGTLVLDADNTYSGGTTIAAGTLQATHGSVLNGGGNAIVSSSVGTGTVTFTGGTFQAGANNLTFNNTFFVDTGNTGTIDTQASTLTLSGIGGVSNSLTGSGTINKTGTGTLLLDNVGMNNGTVSVQAGTVAGLNVNSLGIATNYNVASGATLDINGHDQSIQTLTGSGTVTNGGTNSPATLTVGTNNTIDTTSFVFSGVIQDGAGSSTTALTVGGTRPMILTGSNTYTGGTTISGGTLQLGNGGTTGSIVGNVTDNGTLAFNRSDDVTFAGAISGSGGLTQIGAGTLTLTGANTNTGTTTVSGGGVKAGAANVFSAGSAHVLFSTLDLNGFDQTIGSLTSVSGAGIVTNNGASAAILTTNGNNTDTSFTGVIQDGTAAVGLVKSGTGTLTLVGANTYTGGTTISGGTLQVAQGTSGGSSSVGSGTVTLDGGTFQTDGSSDLSFTNNFKINATGGTLDSNGVGLTLSGTISDGTGAGQLKLTDSSGGFGFVTLSGNNNYSGGTLVQNTAVLVGNSNALGTGTVTLDHSFFVSNAPNLSFSNNFAINSGTSTFDNNDNTLTIAGNIADGNGSAAVQFENSGFSGATILTGANTYTGGTFICSCSTVQLGDTGHMASLVGNVSNLGLFDIVNANTAGILGIANNGGLTAFRNGTTASSMVLNNTSGGATFFLDDQTTAGNATILNGAGSATIFGTAFGTDAPSAGNARITNNGGETDFNASSTAANATITNASNGATFFYDNSTAANARISNESGGLTSFGTSAGSDAPSAGSANITNSNGGETDFNAFSTASNAVITAFSGGKTFFFDNSTGGNAQFITDDTSFVDFGASHGPNGDGHISAGSIAGSGTYYIGGGNTLTVGGNNLSTVVSGVIADNNPCGCTSGSGALAKIGSGTLTLSGANTYSGGTAVNAGTLQIGNNNALGTGLLSMAAGTTLSFTNLGNFTIANNIQISGDPFFAPPAGTTQTLSGVISDGGSPGVVDMIGAGRLVLSGVNTYTGGTTISAGTLQATNNSSVGTGNVKLDAACFRPAPTV